MTDVTQELEYENNNLYRDHYRVALGGVLVMALLSVCLMGLFVWVSIDQQPAKYYATTTTGLIIPMRSLSEPVVRKPYLMQWASIVTRATYNLDALNYQQELDNVKPYFTAGGFDKFEGALKSSGLLQKIIDKRLRMSAIVSGDPVIIREFTMYGRYNWVVQLPLLVSLESASQHVRLHLMATMRIQRVPVLSSKEGIQISDYSVG